MAINKVIRKGTTALDLTSDTVTPETLMSGVTAHNAAGEAIVGTASGGSGGTTLYDEWINLYSLPTTFAVEPPDTGDVTTVYYEIPEGCTMLLFAVGAVKDELVDAGIAYMYNTTYKYWTSITLGTNSLTCSIPDGDSIATITFNYPAAYMFPINSSLLP